MDREEFLNAVSQLNKHRHYTFDQIEQKPAVWLAELVGLEPWMMGYVERNPKEYYPLLVGIIVYRQLGHIEKQRVMEMIQLNVRPGYGTDHRRIVSHLQGLVALEIANPYWAPYSLSDRELREWKNFSTKVADYVQSTGLVASLPEASILGVAGALIHVKEEGILSFSKEILQINLIDKISGKKLHFTAGAGAVMIATFFYQSSHAESESARHELFRRQLLRESEL